MASETSAAGDLTGQTIGNYLVLRRLGSGGMADVYLAEQQSLGRQVALKTLDAHLARDATYVARFNNEARAAAQLVHPNIVQIYEVARAGAIHFIAQEYVRGNNLGELVARHGSLAPARVLDILRQATAALAKAAELGIVHRDIKPENLLLSHEGQLKIADFGLARIENADRQTLTQVGVALGTPLYMSPEQIEGNSVDVRSDLYSLGVTCYHLLAGRPPYHGETALAVAMQHVKTPPEPLENVAPEVPSGLARVVHQLMAKAPDNRFSSPVELLAVLHRLATEAAEQGWGEGPQAWSLAELSAVKGLPAESTAELAALMQQSQQLDKRRSSLKLRLAALIVALVVGLLLGYATRPRFLLADAARAPVEKAETAWAQIYRASLAPSEAAWQAVEEFFPDEDPYVLAQARQGLVRYYLYLSEEYDKALRVLEELAARSGQDQRQRTLQAFTRAGLVIVHEHLDHLDQARAANSRLTAENLDELRRTDRRLYELLETSQRRLQ